MFIYKLKRLFQLIKTCSVGAKAEKNYGDNFFWILGGIPRPEDEPNFIYYIIPSPVMSKNVTRRHKDWLNTPARDGSKHNEHQYGQWIFHLISHISKIFSGTLVNAKIDGT